MSTSNIHGQFVEMEQMLLALADELKQNITVTERTRIDQLLTRIQALQIQTRVQAQAQDQVQAQEAMFSALFNQSADSIMTLAPPTWQFTSCNPATLRLFEVADEESFIKLGPWDFAPEYQPDNTLSSEKAPQLIATAMEKGSHFFDWEHKTLSGKRIKCTVLLSRIDVQGKSYLQATVRDVSKERAVLEALNHSEAKLREAQVIARVGSWRYNFMDGSQEWSSEHYRIFEIDEPQSQEILYKLYRERIHPDDRAGLDLVVARAKKYGEDFTYNHRVYLDNGARIKHVRGIGKVTKDTSGTPLYISGTCQDLTDIVTLQEQNRFILDSMGIGVWQFNPITQELFWDQSMYDLFEISPHTFSGHYEAWENSLTPEAKIKTVHELQLALKGEKEFNTTFEIQMANGRQKHIGGRGIVIRDDLKQPLMMYGINWDRSSEVEHERDLLSIQEKQKEQSEDLKSVFEAMHEGLCFVQPNGYTKFVNSAAGQMLGFDPSEFAKKTIFDLIHHSREDGSKYHTEDSPIFRSLQDRKVYTGEREVFWRKDGSSFPVSYTCIPLVANGALRGGLVTFRDLTQILELQRSIEVERAKTLHSAKLASLGEMSAGIAHEINNPLAVISSSSALLSKFKDQPEKFNLKIDAIQKSAIRIEKIVKGLKKFSRTSEQGIHKPERLKVIFTEALALTEAKAIRESVSIELCLDDEAHILCDGLEIEQVLINLISNAIDATKGQPKRWIKLVCFTDSQHVVVQVIDSGTGISKSVEMKLFQPFFTTKPVGEGTGLGLSISKGILDQHHATISINRSFPNTCFEIRFFRVEGAKNVA